VRVINLSKTVGPTSCPWNDIYGTLRSQRPGVAYPSLTVPLSLNKLLFRKTDCSGVPRFYFYAGLSAAAYLLKTLAYRNNNNLVVHLHTPVLVIVVIAAKLLGARFHLVTTQHNNWATFRSHQKVCLSIAAYLSKGYVACGREIQASLPSFTKKLAHKGGRLHSVPNGIPASFLRDYANKRFALKSNANERQEGMRTIVVARMAPQKNCFHLLHLISRIPELGEVTWYGDGPLREQIEKERDRLGLRYRVTFAGVVSREIVYNALTEHDFYLTVSLWEGLSVADLEAVAIGCIPLMSDIPQRREIAEAVGLDLLPADDLDAWRRQIERYRSMTHHERAHLSAQLVGACT